ncbi:MAG: GNAT family N-acetyltransferase [Oscillatoriales cyanobacterium C42_A2020_001]|nr:GNAT family N-acetyltransferase [Leptolyngbyaceae cyanobacterium C42_A2020_001]
MNSFNFRSATPSDTDAIAQVYLSSRRAFVSFAAIAYSEEAVYEWMHNILIPESQVTVVERDNKIIGMMALSTTEGTGWIDQLYLHPDAVGQEIGTKLIERAKVELGSPIRLYTFQENQGAIRFYERHGFKAIQYRDGSENEENCPDILYEWRV